MRRILPLALASLLLLFSAGCSESSSHKTANASCPTQAQELASEVYSNIPTINYTVTNVALNGNCLDVTVSSSGCNPINWTMNLYSSNVFTDSNPVERQLKVELINNEECLAVFQKTVSYDLTPLQLNGIHEITLNLQGWDTPISYTY